MIKFIIKEYVFMNKIKDFFINLFRINKELNIEEEQQLIKEIYKKIKES